MKSVELFEEARGLPPKEQASYISRGLPQALAGSQITIWSEAEPRSIIGQRVLLGIAPYSLPDLELLDAVKQALAQNTTDKGQLQVFDVLTCASMEDFEKRIPGIGPVYQTPVVGIWENGVLIEKASGAKARQLIVTKYQLDSLLSITK